MSASSRPTWNSRSVAVGDEVAQAGPAPVVGHRREHPARLVQRQDDGPVAVGDPLAVDADDRALRVDAHAVLAHDLTVDLDPAGRR